MLDELNARVNRWFKWHNTIVANVLVRLEALEATNQEELVKNNFKVQVMVSRNRESQDSVCREVRLVTDPLAVDFSGTTEWSAVNIVSECDARSSEYPVVVEYSWSSTEILSTKTKGRAHVSGKKDTLELINVLRGEGYQVQLTNNGHYKVLGPNGVVTLASTPSDYRDLKAALMSLKNAGCLFHFRGRSYGGWELPATKRKTKEKKTMAVETNEDLGVIIEPEVLTGANVQVKRGLSVSEVEEQVLEFIAKADGEQFHVSSISQGIVGDFKPYQLYNTIAKLVKQKLIMSTGVRGVYREVKPEDKPDIDVIVPQSTPVLDYALPRPSDEDLLAFLDKYVPQGFTAGSFPAVKRWLDLTRELIFGES